MEKTLSKILLCILFLGLSTPAFAKDFKDVDQNEIYYDAIQYTSSEEVGIIDGNPDGTFEPLGLLNRAQTAKIMAYALTDEATINSHINDRCFPDVTPDKWYAGPVCYAAAEGWIKGYAQDNGTFLYKPTRNVSFVEANKIVTIALGFEYSEDSDPWYRASVDNSSDWNTIPYNVTSFNDSLRRNQMADMVTRFLKFQEGEEALADYLGDRAGVSPSYDTISEGIDLSALQSENLCPEGEQCK